MTLESNAKPTKERGSRIRFPCGMHTWQRPPRKIAKQHCGVDRQHHRCDVCIVYRVNSVFQAVVRMPGDQPLSIYNSAILLRAWYWVNCQFIVDGMKHSRGQWRDLRTNTSIQPNMKYSSGDFSLVLPAALPVDLGYRVYTIAALDLQTGPSNAAGTTVVHRRRPLLFLVSRRCQQNKNSTQ